MSTPSKAPDPTPMPVIAGCSLEGEELPRQRERYARVARRVAGVAREGETLVVHFHSDFDRATLEEALAVERECCPFFRFAFDEREVSLTVSVAEPEQAPALDAIAASLARDPSATPA